MSPNTEIANTSPANPQMPMFDFVPGDSPLVDETISFKSTTTTNNTALPSMEKSINISPKNGYERMPSWKQFAPEAQFNIGILIDNTSIKDHHVVAISRPASLCTLSSLVILHHPSRMNTTGTEATPDDADNPDEVETSFVASAREWLRFNKAENVVDDIVYGQGQGGWEKMIQSSEIDAVYIVVPPWCVIQTVGMNLFLSSPQSSSPWMIFYY
jgi:hypothetical protein